MIDSKIPPLQRRRGETVILPPAQTASVQVIQELFSIQLGIIWITKNILIASVLLGKGKLYLLVFFPQRSRKLICSDCYS
jgi:hypothetical protein